MYDYHNKAKNMEVYGQEKPPIITEEEIGSAGVPILMISGKYDRIVNIEENRRRS